jgi:two-component system response regulator MprA
MRILVVDDDVRLAASIRRVLAYEGYQVEVVGDGHAALERVAARSPDLVVLDVMLPGMDGVEVCERLRASRRGRDPGPAILMLTARGAVEDRVTGLDAGADDYLGKPFAYEELLARVRALLRRGPAAGEGSGEILRVADVELDLDAHEVRRAGRPIELSATGFALLACFLRSPRIVLRRERILDAVWGMEADTASNLVDVYVGYLRRALEAEGGPRLIHTVRGVGYVLKPPAGV